MGEKDIAEKNLTSANKVFADIFNVFIFKGRQVIDPNDLEDVRARSPWLNAEGKLSELERDVVKYWKKGGVVLSLFGIESQTERDPDMALRMIAYDGVSYREQLKRGVGARRYPVISLVLYFGMKPWGKGLLLSEIVDFPDGEAETLAPFFNDYHINLIEVRELSPETIALFRSDFRTVAKVIVAMSQRLPLCELDLGEVEDSAAVLAMLTMVSGDERFERAVKEWKNQPKEKTMNDLFESYLKDEFQRGDAQGFQRGEKSGFQKGEKSGEEKKARETAVCLKNMGMNVAFIAKALKVDENQATALMDEAYVE